MIALRAGCLVAALAAGWVGLAVRRVLRTRRAVSHAEHELRGPLTAVLLAVDLGLRDGGLTAGQLSVVRAELRRAERAVTDLARARRGLAPVTAVTEVDVPRIARDSVEAWRPAAIARGVRLEFSVETRCEPIMGDPVRLAQATGNLIANAIEHGGSRVHVTAGSAASGVTVAVTDDGPGLPRDIVASDGRVAPPRPARHRGRSLGVGEENQAGRGHGLAIVAGIAVAHGGRLRALARGGEVGGDGLLASTDGDAGRAGASLVLELPAAFPA